MGAQNRGGETTRCLRERGSRLMRRIPSYLADCFKEYATGKIHHKDNDACQ
jgi:hypothetical protein